MILRIATSLSIGLLSVVGAALAQVPQIPLYTDHTNLMVVNGQEDGKSKPVASVTDWQVRRDHILGNLQTRDRPASWRANAGYFWMFESRKSIESRRTPGARSATPASRAIACRHGCSCRRAVRAGRPAALCLHQTVSIGKDEPVGLGGRETLRYGKELAERGYVVLAPDYPGFGEHQVDVYELGYLSATMKAVWDNMRGVDLLQSLPEVDPEKVVAIGHSLGGHNAIYTSVFDKRIRAVVSSCGFNSFPFYYGGNLTGWSHRGYMPRIESVYAKQPANVPFDFPELVGALAPRGFFTNSPLEDQNFEVEGVKVCLDAARPVYRLLGAESRLKAEFPQSGHDFPDEQRVAAYEFLDEMVGWEEEGRTLRVVRCDLKPVVAALRYKQSKHEPRPAVRAGASCSAAPAQRVRDLAPGSGERCGNGTYFEARRGERKGGKALFLPG